MGIVQIELGFRNPDKLPVFDKEPYIYNLPIKDVFLIKRPRYLDQRGGFQELGRLNDISEALGREVEMPQFQLSESRPGVLRGIHVEPEDKLVTPLWGNFKIVLVDLRRESETFLNYISFDLNLMKGSPKYTINIPERVGNSFFVYPGDIAFYLYHVSKIFDPSNVNCGVRWDSVGINWPTKNPELSERDKNLPTIQQYLVSHLAR